VWTSTHETVVNTMKDSANGGSLGPLTLTKAAGSWTYSVRITLGAKGSSRYDVSAGSNWVGIRSATFAGFLVMKLYGSMWDGIFSSGAFGVNAPLRLNTGAEVIGSVVKSGVLILQHGTLMESVVLYGRQALQALGVGDQANLLLSAQDVPSVVSSAATISGLLVGDDVATPAFLFTAGTGILSILDPRAAYDIFDLLSFSFGTAEGELDFTYNPRFVSRDSAGSTPAPIEGLVLSLYAIDESDLSETPVFEDEETDASGRLFASAGTFLYRQYVNNGDNFLYSHRLVIQGGGYRIVRGTFQITGPELGDIPVDRISPDYEGEFGE